MSFIVAQLTARVLDHPAQRVLFLDRDGVINERAKQGEYITSWDVFQFRDGILDLLIATAGHGFRNVVITNQQCIGKRIVSRRDVDDLHRKMIKELAAGGARIDGVYYCPHLEVERCACRKPRPGLLFRAASNLSEKIDLERSYFLGDTESDVAAGKAFGVQTILLRDPDAQQGHTSADYLVRTLDEVKDIILC